MVSHPHPRSSLPILAVGLCVAVAATGCSLLEKEFDSGRSTPRSDLNSDGLSAEQDSGDEWGERPGGSGTDPDGGSGSGSGSSGGSGSDGGSGSSGGSGSGSSGGSGGEGEDGDGDGDGSGSAGSDRVDCTSGAVTPDGTIDSCVSDILTCGDSFVATTRGGNSVMNADDYVSWFCTPLPDGDYDGRERTYHITVPAGGKATFTLESPCDDLDIFVLRWELWESNEQCPDYNNSVIECEADDSSAGGEVEVYADPARDTNYLVMIDGPDGEQAAFGLDVTCE